MKHNTNRTVRIYDTTLRDGAQGEGISFSGPGKIKLALRLDQFGIDYIEGGYAGSNQKDMTFFHEIRKYPLKHARVAAFGSTRRAEINVADDLNVAKLIEAGTPVTTIVGKSSRLHVEEVLRTTPEENLAMIADTIRYLKRQHKEVFFDAEHFFDGYKLDAAYALLTLRTAADAGADGVVLCDTNGGCLPHEIFQITAAAVKAVSISVGIHTHNDGGLAVANSLEAVRAGATQVQGTMNGYGERCGNANLCTIIPSLQLKMDCPVVAPASLRQLRPLALFVDDLVNLRPDGKSPFVGESAFSHKAGLHANAVQKNPVTMEHLEPELVGNKRRILVSEEAGTSSVLMKAAEMGLKVDKASPQVREVLEQLKSLEHRGYAFEAADASFRILVQKVLKRHKPFFELDGFRVIIEKRGSDQPCVTEATVKLRVGGEVEHTVAEGDGPVNALDLALRRALIRFYPEIAKVILTDFRVRILDPEEATAAKTRVLIESGDGDESWGTVGVSENIIEASWQALVDSVEYKLFREEDRRALRKDRGAGKTGTVKGGKKA